VGNLLTEIYIHWARLVLGWVTVFGGQTTSVFHQATQAKWPTQLSTLSGTGNEYQYHLLQNIFQSDLRLTCPTPNYYN